MKKTLALFFPLVLAFASSALANEMESASKEKSTIAEKAAAYEAAAKAGDTEAEVNLGIVYLNDTGKFHEYKKAKACFMNAAKKENAKAQYWLGVMFYKGKGTVPDVVHAYHWFSLSAHYGMKEAEERMGVLVNLMTPKQLKIAQEMTKAWLKEHDKK